MKSAMVAGPAPEAAIREAEEELGVSFPPAYREFLREFGAALAPTFEIAGLFPSTTDDEPPFWTDVVSFTKEMRKASRGRIPLNFVAISDDGGDYKFYLDASSEKRGEHPVLALGPGADAQEVATDFYGFLRRLSKENVGF